MQTTTTPQPAAPSADQLLSCVCGRGLALVVRAGQALQLAGGLIVGRTPIACDECGRVRIWKPLATRRRAA